MHATNEYDLPLGGGVRDQILAAASAEFADNGLNGASVRAIAGRAGTTAAMINYYFGGKRSLYDSVLERAQARLLAVITSALGESDAGPLASRLAVAYFDFLSRERDLPRLLLREVLDDGEAVRAQVHKHVEPLRSMLAQSFGAGDDTFQAVVSLFGAIAGYFMYAPVMASILGEDPLALEPLARRRQHVLELAGLVTQLKKTSNSGDNDAAE